MTDIPARPPHVAGARLEVIEPPGSGFGIDMVRAVFTYSLALIVVVGGGGILVLTRADETGDLRVMLAGFIGSALTFAFGQEVQTRTARQAASSTAASTAATTATIAAANGGVGPMRNGGGNP